MKLTRAFLLFSLLVSSACLGKPSAEPYYEFDKPDQSVAVTRVGNTLSYDAAVALRRDGLWVTWIEFVPGKGDQLWIGLRRGDEWSFKKQISKTPADFSNPTVNADGRGQLWLSFESVSSGRWQVFVCRHEGGEIFSDPEPVSIGSGPNIQHRVAPNPNGGIWVVWQGDAGGQFDVFAKQVPGKNAPICISTSKRNDWAPSATVTPQGALHVAWDSYDGSSYNVLERSLEKGKLSPIRVIAGSENLEAHTQICSDHNGKVWITWEEDGPNWGKAYRSRFHADKKSTSMTDRLGPLHRYRKLHVAELDSAKQLLREYSFPMPSMEMAQTRKDIPEGVKLMGAFYERGQLAIDQQNRPWLVFRHFYTPRLGLTSETHQHQDARLYARCLTPEGWSKLYQFEAGQGDGAQRIFVIPQENGIEVAWTVGRTDRRANDQSEKERGVALAQIVAESEPVKVPGKPEIIKLQKCEEKNSKSGRTRPAAKFAGKHYELFYGDIHRHTDISLCFSACDGTIDDAYRYAMDAAPLDFFGVTDHTHDLAGGDQLSLIWWRTRKEVNRHYLATAFIPLFSYERSRGDTDHNVFSLRDDMLRPHGPPLPDFWSELDNDTFTIPHQPFKANTWKHKDNAHRPLLEIFQGFRNESMEEDAHVGLKQGHEMGFVAASDHLSTGVSFACVWAEKPDRETLFRALQARRTFGATAKIVVKATCDGHWMGEKFSVQKPCPVQLNVQPTAPIETVDLIVDGDVAETRKGATLKKSRAKGSPLGEFATAFQLPKSLSGEHWCYLRIKQADGNMAWSSPFWMDIAK